MNFLSKLSQLSGKMRIAVVLPVLWLIIVGLICAPTKPWEKFVWKGFLGVGVLPSITTWSVLWITQGFKKDEEIDK